MSSATHFRYEIVRTFRNRMFYAVTVARLGARSAPVVAAMALAALLVPVAVGSWHVSLAKSFADVTPVAIPVVALVMAGVMQMVRSTRRWPKRRRAGEILINMS